MHVERGNVGSAWNKQGRSWCEAHARRRSQLGKLHVHAIATWHSSWVGLLVLYAIYQYNMLQAMKLLHAYSSEGASMMLYEMVKSKRLVIAHAVNALRTLYIHITLHYGTVPRMGKAHVADCRTFGTSHSKHAQRMARSKPLTASARRSLPRNGLRIGRAGHHPDWRPGSCRLQRNRCGAQRKKTKRR